MTNPLQLIIRNSIILSELSLNQHRAIKDLENNFEKTFLLSQLPQQTIASITLAVCYNQKNLKLLNLLRSQFIDPNLSSIQQSEIIAIAATMNMNNNLYSFKHTIHHSPYLDMPSTLNMSHFVHPAVGKTILEIVALNISNLNHCIPCTQHHEEKCLKLGIQTDTIYQSIQLSSFVKSLCIFDYSNE